VAPLELENVPGEQAKHGALPVVLNRPGSQATAPHASRTLLHPVCGLQMSVVQASSSLQFSGLDPTHVPATQKSLAVQALKSMQGVPLAFP
jgi:hypothetical protein